MLAEEVVLVLMRNLAAGQSQNQNQSYCSKADLLCDRLLLGLSIHSVEVHSGVGNCRQGMADLNTRDLDSAVVMNLKSTVVQAEE